MKAVILMSLLTVGLQAHVAVATGANRSVVHVSRVPSIPGMTRVVPPLPPAVKPVSFQADGSDLYSCGRGSAVNYASTYRAFESRHQAVASDRAEGYVAAQVASIADPEYPAGVKRLGYVSVLVAVSDRGTVVDSLLVCSADALFDEEVSKAARSVMFKPATYGGVAVASLETIEYWMLHF